MVRATKIGSVVVGLAASGLAWGQSALMPPAPAAEPAGKIITVSEPGKPAQKCRLIKMWTQPNGGKACQVQAIASGEMMTVVQSAPAAGGGRTLAMTIYHWSGTTPHPDAPMPPMTVETTPIVKTSAAFVQEAAPMPAAPMPGSAPVVKTPANVSSVFVPQHGPVPAAGPMPGAPQRAPGPMTPGGVVLTPVGSAHDYGSSSSCGDCGACGDCGTCCKPSLLERLKGCFRRDCCSTCCPEACTTCTPTSAIQSKTAGGEMIVPAPTATVPVPIKETTAKPVTGLFHRNKPADDRLTTTARTETLDGTPHADNQKADPLKDPAAYSKTTAELAAAPLPQVDAPKPLAPLARANPPKPAASQVDVPNTAVPVMAKGHIPLGAASVVAAGDPQYLPVPIVTQPDARPPMPVTQVPEAPQPNQRLLANAFGQGGAAAATSAMAGEMPGNAFAPSVAGSYVAPGFVPPGYGGTAYGQPLPAMPMGPAIQPGFYGPPRGQMIAPAGYYPMPPAPQMQQPMVMPLSSTSAVDVPSLLNQLRDSMLPSQREWAAEKLTELEWRKSPQVVDALVQAAKDDPAASVRAGCIHCLARMSAATPPVIAVIQSLKTDADPRVQHEATEALARLAPGQAPAPMSDPAVQPAGGLVPPPLRSN
jgi:hypothetical protein